jgi:undecaprenyl-diphosphatase
VPAVLIGGLLAPKLKDIFGSPMLAAGFLVVNGVMLFVAERAKKGSAGTKPLSRLSWVDALVIGCWQCLALIPGLSRSGATMTGGYLTGLKHEDAARFSFLTATPIILAATAFEMPKILKGGAGMASFSGVALLSGLVAGVVAFISVAALMRWFRDHEAKAFDPFAIYCVIAGLGALAYIKLA